MSLPKPYYDKDGITIYNADCREILPFVGEFDLCLTDPPYGENWNTNYSRFSRGFLDKKAIVNDGWKVPLSSLQAHSKEQIVFGANYLAYPAPGSYLIWDKRCADGFSFLSDAEVAWWSSGAGCYIFSLNAQRFRSSSGGEHPTQKPTPLMAWCIEKAKQSGTILDPFMGSGTTLVAAKQLGRRAVGIEIEEKYCEIAVQRLAQDILDFGGTE